MWKYHIDELTYVPNKEIEIKGWLIGDANIEIILDENQKIELGRDLKREDVLEIFNNNTDMIGFQKKIDIDRNIKKIEILAYDNENKISLLKFDENELIRNMPKQTILYNIDSVEIINENVNIRGWVFSEYYENVEVEIKNVKDYEIKKYERLDVIKAYDNFDTVCKVGFEINCKNHKLSNKINIIFKDNCSEESIIIDKSYLSNKSDNLISYIYKNLSLKNIKTGLKYVQKYGYKNFINKIKIKNSTNTSGIAYGEWLKNHMPKDEELKEQKDFKFEYSPLISIVVPTYNTPEKFLREMIESVINQTYLNWELCIADGSDEQSTIHILKEYSEKYSNIKIKYLDTNEGISGNTNKALELAEGEYIGLFDHDDLLTQNALYEIVKVINENDTPEFIYTDEDKVDETGLEFFDPHFKPDWSPDTLRSYNYITHFSVFKKDLLEKVGNFRSECDGSQDYDMFLRITEKSKNIYHIPKILYHWRCHKNSTAYSFESKGYTMNSAKIALMEHIKRLKIEGVVKDGLFPTSYNIEYTIKDNPKISIIIPNKDALEDLRKCIESIRSKTEYDNYEIIIVENNSQREDVFEYYEKIEKYNQVKVVSWEGFEFNYSAINNFGIKFCTGEYIVLLNNDIEVITPTWIENMLMYAQREDVGIVGCKLYYPDNSIQHAGVILGIGGIAGHSHKYFDRYDSGKSGRLKVVQNLSAVTAACLMIKKSIFAEVEGLDENFKVAFNDIDLCMKIRSLGKLIIWTPYVEMYHYESKSRGSEDTPEKINRFQSEINKFKEKWEDILEKGDPYYNINLTLEKEDFSLKINDNLKESL